MAPGVEKQGLLQMIEVHCQLEYNDLRAINEENLSRFASGCFNTLGEIEKAQYTRAKQSRSGHKQAGHEAQ